MLTLIGLILTVIFGFGKMVDEWCMAWTWFGVFAPLIVGGILDMMGRAICEDDWFSFIIFNDLFDSVTDDLDWSDFGGHDD